MSKSRLRVESVRRGQPESSAEPESVDQKQLELGGAWESINWDAMRVAARDRFGIEIAEDDALKLMVFMFSLAMQGHWQAVGSAATDDIAAVVKKFREQAEDISSTERAKFRDQLLEYGGRLGGIMHVNVESMLEPLRKQVAEISTVAEALSGDNSATKVQYGALGFVCSLAVLVLGVFAGILFCRYVR